MKRRFIKKRDVQPENIEPLSKGNFPDFMKKEIFTQNELFRNIWDKYVSMGKIDFDFLKLKTDKLKRIYIAAQHCYYGCAHSASHNLEVLSDLPCVCSHLSEFNCSNPVLDKNSLVIIIADNDWDNDVKSAGKRSEALGAKTIFILSESENKEKNSNCIVIGSESVSLFPTAAYSAKYLVLCMLSLYIGEKFKIVTELYVNIAIKMMIDLDNKLKEIMELDFLLKEILNETDGKRLIFTGKNVDFSCADYASKAFSVLAKRDVSALFPEELNFYVHNIEDTVLFCFVSNRELMEATLMCCEKYKDIAVVIAPNSIGEELENWQNIITYPDSIPLFNPVLAGAILQLMFYNDTKNKSLPCDRDNTS